MFGMPESYDQFNSSQAQPNQYSDGNLGDVNNTQWMQPTGGGDSTLAGSDSFNPSASSPWTGGISGNGQQSGMNQPQTQPMQMLPPAQTAIEAVQNGWGFNSGKDRFGQPKITNQNPFAAPTNQIPVPAGSNQQTPNSFGAPPIGFDADKWNDPTKGTSLKYIAGRMAAANEPIEKIAAAVGAKVISKDKIQYPDGFVADLWFDEENATGQRRAQYTDVTPEGQYKPGSAPTLNKSGAGVAGQAAGNAMSNQSGMDMAQMMQQMMFMQNQAKRAGTAARTSRLRGRGFGVSR